MKAGEEARAMKRPHEKDLLRFPEDHGGTESECENHGERIRPKNV